MTRKEAIMEIFSALAFALMGVFVGACLGGLLITQGSFVSSSVVGLILGFASGMLLSRLTRN